MTIRAFFRTLTTLAIPCALTLLAGGCAKSGGDTVRIGLIAELTGNNSAVGASCRNAAQMVVERLNASGGIQVGAEKKKVELFVEDNADKADQSAIVAQKLITQQEVLAVVGPNASRNAIPAAEAAERAGVPMITPWATNPKATLDARSGAPKKYVFRACFIDPFQGSVVARFARENLKAAKAAVLYDVGSEYNKGIADFFKDTFTKKGGQVVAFESYPTGEKDFNAQLTKIKGAAPDVIFLPNYYYEIPDQIRQAHQQGIDVPFVGSDSWGSPDLLKGDGAKVCEGYYFSTHYAADAADTSAATKEFIKDYQAKYGNAPDDVAALTADSCDMIFKAIAAAGKLDREAVREALAKVTEYQGITGKMKFSGTGDPVKSAVILQIKGGKFAWFATVNP